MPNPFTPSFGKMPPIFAGRRELLADMQRALNNGMGDPSLSTLLVGARGTGKTALLSRVSDMAESCGWVAASSSAVPGMLEDLFEQSVEAASHLVGSPSSPRVKSVSVGNVLGVEFERLNEAPGNWRTRMTRLVSALNEQGVGLLLTVDEVTTGLDEMVILATAYQHFVRENRQVALVMAGLPHNVSGLLGHQTVSFLRRARQHHLGRIDDVDVESAFRKTVAGAGRSIEDDALAAATEAIDGFPYMMQLVGFWTWEECGGGNIALADVRRGISLATRDLTNGVLDRTYKDLSAGDLRFLHAMLADEKDSSLADIAKRMGVKSNYASKYKERLLEAGVIGERGRGHYGIDLPAFRDYLRDMDEE